MTMSDEQVAEQIARANDFHEELRATIHEAIAAVTPASACADEARAGLKRISDTLDAVPFVMFANLSNIDTALERATGCGLMELIEVRLLAVGAGPTLDFTSATDFLGKFQPMIDAARKRRIN